MITFIADLHFGSKNNHLQTFENQMSFFEKQFFPFLLDNKVKDVIVAGDVFDNRNTVGIQILQELRYRFFEWFEQQKVNCHWILGNHDVVANNTLEWNVAKASRLECYDYIKVYSEPTRIEIDKYIFGFVPWITDNKLVIPDKIDICVGHFDIASFYVTKGIESKSGFSISDFKQYKLILSGHYHIADRKHNIQYLGNPYQKDWGDYELAKGFWTLEDNFNLNFHENKISPRHIKVTYNEVDNEFECKTYGLSYEDEILVSNLKNIHLISKLCSNNHVKFVIESRINNKVIDKIYNSMIEYASEGFTPQLINVTEMLSNLDEDKMQSEIKEDSDVIGNMKLYTESVVLKDDIDKELLVELFEEIYKETIVGEICNTK